VVVQFPIDVQTRLPEKWSTRTELVRLSDLSGVTVLIPRHEGEKTH
jgi:hypothetical protein